MGFHKVVEGALAEERANALGRAGRKLDEAIDTHRLLLEVGAADEAQVATALTAVRDAAWALMVQRECAGFRSDGRDWLRTNYALPTGVAERL